MKRILTAVAILAATLSPLAQASDVGFSVNIGQPGFYGRLDVGGFPAPALIYPQPMMIERGSYGRPPLYLRVPPGHARNWRRHCHSYRACGEQVYFVRDDWYRSEYAPRYQERHVMRSGNYRPEHRTDFRHDPRYERYDRNDGRRDGRHDGNNHRGGERHERHGGDRDRGGERGHGNGRDH